MTQEQAYDVYMTAQKELDKVTKAYKKNPSATNFNYVITALGKVQDSHWELQNAKP